MFRPKTFVALGLTLALGLTFGVGSASATPITYSLTINNGGFGNPPGPYGTVTVDLVSSVEATLTLTNNQIGSNVYLFGATGVFDFNTNGSVTIQSISESNIYTDSGFGAFTPGPGSSDGSGNVSSFGVFNNTIKNFDGYQHSASSMMVDITLNSGSWASAADVLTANADGNTVAGHVFLAQDNGNGTVTTSGLSGFVTNGPPTPVPEPATLSIFALGLAGIGARRRRQRSTQP